MLKTETVIVGLMCFAAAAVSCKTEREISSESSAPAVAVSANADSADIETADFSKIAAHPHLFMSKTDEEFIKKNLASNKVLAAVHAATIRRADKMLDAPKLERVFMANGYKMLPTCREYLNRICALAYAARMTGDDRYVAACRREMLNASDFLDWNRQHFLDTAEMSLAVAIGYDWLYDKLDAETRKKISEALVKKGIDMIYVGKNWWEAGHTNHNQVNCAGIIAAALAVYEDNPKLSRDTVMRLLKANENSFKAYEPDGVYPEGCGYWSYGTGYETILIDALESSLGSSFGLRAHKAFFKSAEFMQFAVGSSGLVFNYSDGSAKLDLSDALIWFAAQGDNSALLYPYKFSFIEALEKPTGAPVKMSFGKDRMSPLYMKHIARVNFADIKRPSKYFWSGGGVQPVAMVRTDWDFGKGLYLGIKGGRASYSHGHCDAGTFVFDVGPTRWVCDVPILAYVTYEGQGIKLRNKQDSEKWTLARWHNSLHNTISIIGETFNVEGQSEIIGVFDTPQRRGAKIELTPVYGGKIKLATREAAVVGGEYLEIADTLEGGRAPQKMRWNICTEAAPEVLDANTLRLKLGGKSLLVSIRAEGVKAEAKVFRPQIMNPRDKPIEGSNFAGFDFELPAGAKAVLTAVLKLEK